MKKLVFSPKSTLNDSVVFMVGSTSPVVEARGIPESVTIYLEVIYVDPTRPPIAGLENHHLGRIDEIMRQSIIGVHRIPCYDCKNIEEGYTIGHVRRVTRRQPLMIVDLPTTTYYRFVWEGPELGEHWVFLHEETDAVPMYGDATKGCPCILHEEDPNLWVFSGNIRCNIEDDVVEWQYIYNDGTSNRQVWLVKEPLTWRDTGVIRENGENPSDEHYDIQQVNNCGGLRWQSRPWMLWSDTGKYRSVCPDTNHEYEKEQKNDFGRFRWVPVDCVDWVDTANQRELCEPDDEIFEQEQRNQFGGTQWVEKTCMFWTNTGLVRPVCPDTNDNYELQQVNQFGRFRWVEVDCVNWTPTGKYRELCPQSDDEYEFEESNQYGGTRWTIFECGMEWSDTGVTREKVDITEGDPDEEPPTEDTFLFNDEIYEKQQVNRFGRLRWIDAEYVVWEDTGETREIMNFVEGDPEAVPPTEDTFEEEDYLYEKQQVNQFGRFRWLEATIPMQWSATGKFQTADSGAVKQQLVNQFGRFTWEVLETYIAPVAFIPYAARAEELTTAINGMYDSGTGEVDLTATKTIVRVSSAVTVEKGYGFIAGDLTADPDATVLVSHPLTGAADFVAIYPAPLPNATIEVYDSLVDPHAPPVLLGYARNNPLGIL